jgi:xanthine dehydrogenase YagR molybdenum-binding subunit
VVWGIGMALHEETLIDHRLGRIINANIAEYHVPVNADIHDIRPIQSLKIFNRQTDRESQWLNRYGIVSMKVEFSLALASITARLRSRSNR